MRSRLTWLVPTLVGLTLAACATPKPVPTPQLAFTSPSEGSIVYGPRTITVQVALVDALPTATIDVTTDARDHSSSRVGDTLEVELELKDHLNSLTVTVTNPGQAVPGTATLHLDYPFLTLSDQQAASVVIGQADFVTDTEPDPEKAFDSPYLRPLVLDGVLYLPDYGLGRVMGYDTVPTTNDVAADFVLGKQDFLDGNDAAAADTMSGPQTLATDGRRLYALDYSLNRILRFDTPPTTSGASADLAIGQADLSSDDAGASNIRFGNPESMSIAAGKLIVADASNNRVLIWSEVPNTPDVPADIVLGQADMNSGSPNRGGVVGEGTLDYPTDVWSDGQRLVVVDSDNSRVLIWNTFPTQDGAPADVVLGQPDMTSDATGLADDRFNYPYSAYSNGNQLFIADSENNRVLVWDSFPTTDGQKADRVLGQADFVSAVYQTSQTGMSFPTGVYVDGNRLFVADNDNRRYLIFVGAEE